MLRHFAGAKVRLLLGFPHHPGQREETAEINSAEKGEHRMKQEKGESCKRALFFQNSQKARCRCNYRKRDAMHYNRLKRSTMSLYWLNVTSAVCHCICTTRLLQVERSGSHGRAVAVLRYAKIFHP